MSGKNLEMAGSPSAMEDALITFELQRDNVTCSRRGSSAIHTITVTPWLKIWPQSLVC